jgi:hypothetical protein
VKGPGSQNIPETLPTLGAQETGGRQIKHKSAGNAYPPGAHEFSPGS